MIICRTSNELVVALNKLSKIPGKLALIPTMGNLHDGHLSLIKIAKKNASKTISTIFVNPLQFAQNEDFDKYPRTQDEDIKKLNNEGCDILFIPRDNKEVFSSIENVKTINSGALGSGLSSSLIRSLQRSKAIIDAIAKSIFLADDLLTFVTNVP